ncbi:MAG: L,D-transpeptidase [Planctomycetes bacterium]|nr:L,D-transpeptidase [Planctomycetota bacterium]
MIQRHMPLRTLLQSTLALGFVLLLSGCASNRKTWEEWMESESTPMLAAGAQEASWTKPHVDPLVLAEGYEVGDGARAGKGFDLEARNPGFPDTYIDRIYVDVTDPYHELTIHWTGPLAELGPTGPWRSNPGRGIPDCDCDDFEQSNMVDSWCTPKGLFPVAGFADHLTKVTACHYVTWIQHAPRYIGLHSHIFVPSWADSHGCVRVAYDVAKLIHNNSKVGDTLISIDGTWTRPDPKMLTRDTGGSQF